MPPTAQTHGAKVLLVCSGLDHARRGFESFARDAFDALREEPSLHMELVKGSGPAGDRERSVWTLRRDDWLAKAFGQAWGREPFRVEQVAFAIGLQRELLRRDPDVLYFSEWHTGLMLAWLRRTLRRRYRLVLSNGTMATRGFDHLDRVQELTPAAYETVITNGADPARHTMLPLGFPVPPAFEPLSDGERDALRARLGLPVDRRIVFSCAAINRHHKRIDYLIEEVAQLPAPRPFLLVAGQPEAETPGLRALAEMRLGADGHSFRTVPHAEVEMLYRASDLFVLASLGEGLPRVLIEAMSHGLPCLAHDYPVARFALAEHGRYADFTSAGGLAQLLAGAGRDGRERELEQARYDHAYENFSWDRLRPRYVELLRAEARPERL